MNKMIGYTMYFGSDIQDPDMDNVSDEMFATFLKNVVDPFFPGYTVTIGAGSWKGKAEKTWVLEVLIPLDDCPVAREILPGSITTICNLYTDKFKQDSVLVKMSPCFVTF